jgi:hypothetical protein
MGRATAPPGIWVCSEGEDKMGAAVQLFPRDPQIFTGDAVDCQTLDIGVGGFMDVFGLKRKNAISTRAPTPWQ